MTSSALTSNEIPWTKCMHGCELPVDGQVHFFPCLHVLCSSCFDQMEMEHLNNQQQLSVCKVCLQKFQLTQIRRHVNLEDFLKTKTLMCQKCVRSNNLAVSFCTDCEPKKYLCSICSESHPFDRDTRQHKLDRNLEERKSIELIRQNLCKAHNYKKTSYFCLTCQYKMCEVCKESHGATGIHDVLTVAEEMTRIHSQLESTKEVREKMGQAITKLEDNRKSLKSEWENYKERVNYLFEEAKTRVLDNGRKQQDQNETTNEEKLNLLRPYKAFVDITEKLDLDDIGMINLARTALPGPESKLHYVKEMLGNKFDSFVIKGESLVANDARILNELLTHLTNCNSSTPPPKFSNQKVRRVALKSTANRNNCRPLGMPHTKKMQIKVVSKTTPTASSPELEEEREEMQVNGLTTVLSSNNSSTWGDAGANRADAIVTQGILSPPSPLIEPTAHCSRDLTSHNIRERSQEIHPDCVDPDVHETGNTSSHAGPSQENEDKSLADITNGMDASLHGTSSTSLPSALSSLPFANLDISLGKRERKKKKFVDCLDPESLSGTDSPKTGSGRKRGRPAKKQKSNEECADNVNIRSIRHCNVSGNMGKVAPTQSLVSAKENTFSSSDDIKPDHCDFPIQRWIHPAKHAECKDRDCEINSYCYCKKKECPCKENDGCCAICLDDKGEGKEKVLCCGKCDRSFHIKCHVPALPGFPKGVWQCNCCKSKEKVEQELEKLPNELDSEERPLTEANPREFARACKFMIEIYKIPEVPTIKWAFPPKFIEENETASFHLNFLRNKLCLPAEDGLGPFPSVEEFMEAFRKMFMQAFRTYKGQRKVGKHASDCFQKFRNLVKDYYPGYTDRFTDLATD